MNRDRNSERTLPINDRIRAKTVRVIDEDGKQIGVIPLREAIEEARRQGADLFQVSPGEIPVCRIGDAGKFQFDRKKQQRETARRQRELVVDTKEIQLRPVTDTNDIAVKSKRAREFLQQGDKVKVVVRFRGREQAHKQEGRKVVDEFLVGIGEHKIERPLTDQGRDMLMILAPIKTKSEVVRERT